MPLFDISIAEGRSASQLRALIAAVHDAARATVDAAPENITIIVREVPHEHWSRGDRTIAERHRTAPTDTPATPLT